MPDWLDLGLVAALTAFAVSGYRQGFAAGILSLAGFASGWAAGARASSWLCRVLVPAGPGSAFFSIVIEFAAALTGMLLADALGGMLRRVSRRPAGLIDSIGGAALNITFLLAVAVMISSSVVGGQPGLLFRQVDHSLVLRAAGQVAPRHLLNSVRVSMVRQLDDASGLDPAALPRPSSSVLSSPGSALARRDVVRIVTVARSCPSSSTQYEDGSGIVIARDHVLTNAHVVAGLTRAPVVTAADGRAYQARVVLYDQRRDIAVLYVPGLRVGVLHFTTRSAPYGARAIVAGFPGGGSLSLAPATVGSQFRAGSELQVYPVRGKIQPGDSGGPLLAPGGAVYGIVFARSSAPQSGWALAAADVARDAAAGARLTTSVRAPAHLSC